MPTKIAPKAIQSERGELSKRRKHRTKLVLVRKLVTDGAADNAGFVDFNYCHT